MKDYLSNVQGVHKMVVMKVYLSIVQEVHKS